MPQVRNRFVGGYPIVYGLYKYKVLLDYRYRYEYLGLLIQDRKNSSLTVSSGFSFSTFLLVKITEAQRHSPSATDLSSHVP